MLRYMPFALVAALFLAFFFLIDSSPVFGFLAVLAGGVVVLGIYDLWQKKHTLWRNFPLIGRTRWLAEEMRPFFRSYIVESETEGRPFNIEERAMAYRRAKDVSSVEPFGSHLDMDKMPYEWLAHSMAAADMHEADPRVTVGGGTCAKPYSASVLNISAMSFGSLGAHAIEALNRGAAAGGFYHDTGEGGVSRYHKAGGGDLVWEIGSGYFGCRAEDGSFDADKFAETASLDQIKMIELKLSQGAKPGHGGVLPAEKVTKEIAEARGVPVGKTVVSPASHTAFRTPLELMKAIAGLREMSGGKPVGIKFCVGNRWEVLALCKAMLESGDHPDFIVVDGAEGGTGAAPSEFLDHVGAPLRQGLLLTRNALVGCDLKDKVRLAASGKQLSAFSMAASLALGADWINSARGFMFSLGCIQSLHCHNNTCPTGIATSDPLRQRGLVVEDKARRVANFHRNTVKALMEVVGAAGCSHPSQLRPHHIMHRVTEDLARPAHEAYGLLKTGELLANPHATSLSAEWEAAQAASFAPVGGETFDADASHFERAGGGHSTVRGDRDHETGES